MSKLVVMKKGGGGKVAINPEQVTHIKSATGAFTDVFLNGQQVAVEGTFAESVLLETVVLSILNHDAAVASARKAFLSWSTTPIVTRHRGG